MLTKIFFLLTFWGAILCAPIGLVSLTKVTAGVGVLALGCLFGIIARIFQVEIHNAKTKNREASKDNA